MIKKWNHINYIRQCAMAEAYLVYKTFREFDTFKNSCISNTHISDNG